MKKETTNNYHPDDEIEIIDQDDYGDNYKVFNHQTLIMNVMAKIIEASNHELRSGWFNEKTDVRGNISRIYIEDTRFKFVNIIKSALAIMECDFDKEATDNIEGLLDSLEETKKRVLKEQWDWWESLTAKYKALYYNKSLDVKSKIAFNQELPWWQLFVQEQIDTYFGILAELNGLTKRLDFYEVADFKA